jgi:hypothetical protein
VGTFDDLDVADMTAFDRAKALPVGQISRRPEFLSSPSRKNISLREYPKSNLQL